MPSKPFGVLTPKGLMLSAREFESLKDYSCSLPTGQSIGKRWRRRSPYQTTPGVAHTFAMGEYVETYKAGMIGIQWTPIILPDDYVPAELRQSAVATQEGVSDAGLQALKDILRRTVSDAE